MTINVIKSSLSGGIREKRGSRQGAEGSSSHRGRAQGQIRCALRRVSASAKCNRAKAQSRGVSA